MSVATTDNRRSRRANSRNFVDGAQLARALGGEVNNRNSVRAPGPGHSPADRSLSVKLDPGAPDGFVVNSFAGDDPIMCKDYVREKCGLPEFTADGKRLLQLHKPTTDDYERRQHEKAAWLWSRRRPIAGTPAEHYLREARRYSGLVPQTLAFLPPSKPNYHPAMIAAFVIPDEPDPGELGKPHTVDAVHLTLLRPDGGSKAAANPNKLIIGRPLGRPIVLAPTNDLLGLAITEGIEDALTAHEATGLGAWAAGCAGFMPGLIGTMPNWIEAVTIYAHADKAGQDGADKLAKALAARDIEVRVEGIAR